MGESGSIVSPPVLYESPDRPEVEASRVIGRAVPMGSDEILSVFVVSTGVYHPHLRLDALEARAVVCCSATEQASARDRNRAVKHRSTPPGSLTRPSRDSALFPPPADQVIAGRRHKRSRRYVLTRPCAPSLDTVHDALAR